MSRLELPLERRILQSTGDVVLRAELELELKTNEGTWVTVPFRVDSGTEMTTMPAERAKKRDLPIPKRAVCGLTFRGQEARAGLLRARIVGMDPTEYTFPCYFLGDPNVPPADPKYLLGLTGVVDQVRLMFDGTPALGAPRGVLVVEKI